MTMIYIAYVFLSNSSILVLVVGKGVLRYSDPVHLRSSWMTSIGYWQRRRQPQILRSFGLSTVCDAHRKGNNFL